MTFKLKRVLVCPKCGSEDIKLFSRGEDWWCNEPEAVCSASSIFKEPDVRVLADVDELIGGKVVGEPEFA